MSNLRMDVKGLSNVSKTIQETMPDVIQKFGKKAVYEGAKVVADEIRKELEQILKGSSYRTGDLEAALGISKARDKYEEITAKVGFDGYDRKGVPNQLKARALESGTSRQVKRPFVRPAVNRATGKAEEAMQDIIEEELNRLLGR